MIKIYAMIVLAFIVVLNAKAQIPNDVLNSGLVAWYSSTGNAIDSSSNWNNGTVNSATLTIDRNGNADSVFSPQNKFAVHISNPLGMFHKVGLKLEYRTNRLGILLAGTKYYFTDYTPYTGEQFGGELRRYSYEKGQNVHEKYIYVKGIYGNVDEAQEDSSGFNQNSAVPASNYYGIGGGVGRHGNFKHFFIDINVGLIISVPEVKQDNSFYVTGPGSFLDLKLNLGYQF